MGGADGFDLFEEVVALVIDEDKCREVFYLDFPIGLHAVLGILDPLDALDVVLGEDCGRTADAAQLEAAVFLAGFGDGLPAVTLGQH